MKSVSKNIPKFGIRDKVGYAMGDLGCNLSFSLISSYMFLFYTQCIGVSAKHWAWIIIVSEEQSFGQSEKEAGTAAVQG